VLALAGTVLAQAPAPAGVYRLEPARAKVLFTVNRFGLSAFRGQFAGASGALVLDRGNIAASHLEVSVPVASVATDSRRMDALLAGPGWFDAARYPTITFRSTAVSPTGPASAEVAGDLTLHGVTRRVTFEVKFDYAGDDGHGSTAGFEAWGRIRRSQYGIARYAFLVGDTVELTIKAGFTHASD
jgi:polyisoprenoid-binding protein YceI